MPASPVLHAVSFSRVPGIVRMVVSVSIVMAARADLAHRWSFNEGAGGAPSGTTLSDSVSGAVATVRGDDSEFDGASLRFTGDASGNHSANFLSGYLDLPNGIISSKTNLTVEIWAKPHGATAYDRVFDFGRVSGSGHGGGAAGELVDVPVQGSTPGQTTGEDSLMLSFSVGDDLGQQRMDAVIGGAGSVVFDSALPTTAGTRYHYVFTFEDGVGGFGASGGRVSWYRDGGLIHSADVGFRLSSLEDVNNWIGRSQWTQDFNANASYDELRIWDHALTPAEIGEHLAAGPDGLDLGPPPVPDHLWTFTTPAQSEAVSGTVFADSIAGEEAVLRGIGGSLSGSEVVLPGNGNGNATASTIPAYVDLPNGIVSASPDLTVEAWVTPLSSRFWQRLFDFGRCDVTHGPGAAPGEIVDDSATPGATGAHDNLSLTLNNGNDFDTHQLEGEYDDNGPQFTTSTNPTTAGVEYHYVLVVEDGVGEFGASGCQVRWYRDGVLQNSDDFPFRMVDMEDVNNWIGRSMYTGDSNSNLALNELRIYRRALGVGEIHSSRAAGPDPSSGPAEPPVPAPTPVRKWDFNTASGSAAAGTEFLDSGSGEIATLRGNGGELSGTHLMLGEGVAPTNGLRNATEISAYLELPEGFISSRESLSLEAWITPLSSNTWQRIWDFGNCTTTHGPGAAEGEIVDDDSNPAGFQANDNLFLSLNINGDLGSHRLGGKRNAGAETSSDTDLSSVTSSGSEYHYVMTVEDGAGAGGASGCRLRWYRDGVLRDTVDLPFRLRDMNDVNNWIGRSNWGGDMNSHMAINELRVYDRAIGSREVLAAFNAGADAVFPAPVAAADSVTLHSGGKVLVDVLANDSGGPLAGTLEIVTPPSSGSVEIREGKVLFVHDGVSGGTTFGYRVAGVGGFSEEGVVTVSVSGDLRIADTDFNVPADPPPTALAVVEAFPGLLFNRPVCMAGIPGDSKRMLVCEIGGVVRLIDDVTSDSPSSVAFLDLNAAISGREPGESIQGGANQECGLLSVAVHPDFESNGHFYVFYSVVEAGVSGFQQRVSRFTVPTGQIGSPDAVADHGSEVVLISQYDQGANHQGGDMHFGSDGYLYVSVGDEENPNDFRLNSQRIDKDLFAGMLRIDVDKRIGNLEPNPHASVTTDGGIARFSIPADNPWVGATEFLGSAVDPLEVRTEFYAVGLRSPWRFSIDPETDEIWVGDVGQDRYEEIDIITRGANYGWVFREGAHDIGTSNPGWPERPEGFAEMTVDPIYEYVHNNMAGDPAFKGNSITGGFVYRGSRIPSLQGAYVFGDHVSGHLWSLVRREGDTPLVTRIGGLPSISSFGKDPSNGDVLMTSTPAGAANSNTYSIMRLVSATPDGSFPATLSETGLFADLSDLSPSPGLLPYEPNLRFWSDHALKRRWFAIPGDEDGMTWRKEGAWDYPSGQIWVKHFDLETVRGDPASARRLETRVLVRNESGSYGVSYRWNDEETEATLVEDGGVAFPVEVTVDGNPMVQTWQIPSRAQCITCHNAVAGHALSFNTRQLNMDASIHGFTGNQIDLLHDAGYFANSPEPGSSLPKHDRPDDPSRPLEARVRSYLDVNCAYCHQPGAGGPGWDGRAALRLEATGMVHGAVAASKNEGDELVVPGDSVHSVILSRVEGSNGYTRMPPLATAVVDEEAVALLTEWIESELPGHPLYDAWAEGFALAGGRDDDDDGDGVNNGDEYLFGSDPTSAAGAPPLSVATSGGSGSLSFVRKAFRIYDIETSTDLSLWESWEADSNHGDYSSSDVVEDLDFDTEAGVLRFFRLRVSEP